MKKLLQKYQMKETGQILKGHTKVVSFYLYGYVQFPELSKGLLSYTDYIIYRSETLDWRRNKRDTKQDTLKRLCWDSELSWIYPQPKSASVP